MVCQYCKGFNLVRMSLSGKCKRKANCITVAIHLKTVKGSTTLYHSKHICLTKMFTPTYFPTILEVPSNFNFSNPTIYESSRKGILKVTILIIHFICKCLQRDIVVCLWFSHLAKSLDLHPLSHIPFQIGSSMLNRFWVLYLLPITPNTYFLFMNKILQPKFPVSLTFVVCF